MQSHSFSSFKPQVCYFIRHSRQNHGALVHSSFVIPTAISSFFPVEGDSEIDSAHPAFVPQIQSTTVLVVTESTMLHEPIEYTRNGNGANSDGMGKASERLIRQIKRIGFPSLIQLGCTRASLADDLPQRASAGFFTARVRGEGPTCVEDQRQLVMKHRLTIEQRLTGARDQAITLFENWPVWG